MKEEKRKVKSKLQDIKVDVPSKRKDAGKS